MTHNTMCSSRYAESEKRGDRHEVLARQDAFRDDNNKIWEPFDETREDPPGMTEVFLFSVEDRSNEQEIFDL